MQYVAILRHYTVFADYSEYSENYQDSLIKIYQANKQNMEFYMIPYQQFDIYFLHYKEYVFSTICQQNQESENILIYLQQLKDEFINLITKEKDSLTLKATKLLKATLDSFYSFKKQSKLDKIQDEIKSMVKEKHSLLQDMIKKEIKLDVANEKSEQLKTSVRLIYNN
jgi:hypothetical protein